MEYKVKNIYTEATKEFLSWEKAHEYVADEIEKSQGIENWEYTDFIMYKFDPYKWS